MRETGRRSFAKLAHFCLYTFIKTTVTPYSLRVTQKIMLPFKTFCFSLNVGSNS